MPARKAGANNASVTAPPPKPANLPDPARPPGGRQANRRTLKAAIAGGAGGLVALLFFLQPIVRGWARFNWRTKTKSGAPMEVASAPCSEEVPETFTFWSDGSLDRLQFLQATLARLDAANWLVRTDTGWTPHDFDVFPSTWIRFRFSTVTEELDMGKKHFRCRLNSRWSLPARILFGLLATGLALILFLFAQAVPWLWFSLVLLPLLGWFFESHASEHKALFTRLLDDTGSAHKMVRLPG